MALLVCIVYGKHLIRELYVQIMPHYVFYTHYKPHITVLMPDKCHLSNLKNTRVLSFIKQKLHLPG